MNEILNSTLTSTLRTTVRTTVSTTTASRVLRSTVLGLAKISYSEGTGVVAILFVSSCLLAVLFNKLHASVQKHDEVIYS